MQLYFESTLPISVWLNIVTPAFFFDQTGQKSKVNNSERFEATISKALLSPANAITSTPMSSSIFLRFFNLSSHKWKDVSGKRKRQNLRT